MLQMIRNPALVRSGRDFSLESDSLVLTMPISTDAASPSLPRSICRELVLAILKELPETLMDESTLSKVIAPRRPCLSWLLTASPDVSFGCGSLNRSSEDVVQYPTHSGPETHRVPCH